MKTIAISGLQNTGKSTLIRSQNQQGVKILGETAREVMDKYGTPGKDITFQEFQDIIHYRESERVREIERLKKTRDDLKLLLIDRTSLDNRVYATILQDVGIIEKLNPPIAYNGYDHVIYMNEPIGGYKADTFKMYEGDAVKNRFDKHISQFYNPVVFRNYKEDQQEIDLLLNELLNDRPNNG